MRSELKVRLKSKSLILLALSLFFFTTTAYQALLANRLATHTIEAYAPRVEKQALASIVEALPSSESGQQAAYLAQNMATNIDLQYAALSRAVQSQSKVLVQQAVCWAVVCIFSMFAYVESRRKVASAA